MNSTYAKNINYQTAKNSIIKYASGALLAAGLLFSSCKNKDYLPVSESVKQEQAAALERKLASSDSTLKLAEECFNAGIADGNYSENEMMETLRLYASAETTYSSIEKSGEHIDPKYSVSLDENSKKTMNLLHKTLYGFDYGKSEIEKKLLKQGIDVSVYNPCHRKEESLAWISGILAMAGVFAAIPYSLEKMEARAKRIEEEEKIKHEEFRQGVGHRAY